VEINGRVVSRTWSTDKPEMTASPWNTGDGWRNKRQ
jgi:hypothetical protein